MRNFQTDICGPGRDWQNGKRHPGQIIYGQYSGEDQQEMLSWVRSINGQLKNQSSKMQEYEESMSLTLRTRNWKKSKRIQEDNWKHRWLQPCPARFARKTSMERPVARLLISSLNLHVSWKLVNPQECVWKNLYPNIMRTILQEKGENSLQHHNLVHKFIPERILWTQFIHLMILLLHPPIIFHLFIKNTPKETYVVLVSSMYFIGTRNDASFGTNNLSLGSTWWR